MKLFLCIVIFIIFPLILFGLYVNTRVASIKLDQISQNALQTLKQSEQNFQSLVDDTNDISIRILSNDQVQQFVSGKYKMENYDQLHLDINVWLDGLIGTKRYYDSISFYSGKNVLFERGNPTSEMSQENMDLANQLQGKSFWTTSSNGLEYYRAIMDFNQLGRTIGYQRFKIKEDTIHQFYENLNQLAGSRIALLDNDGLILSSSENNLIGKNIGDLNFIQKILMLKNGYFTLTIEGVKQIVLFYTIQGTNWTLIQVIPEKSLVTVRSTVNSVLLVVFALCILYGASLSFVLYKYLINPLKKMRKEMAKVKTGNFNVNLHIDSKDEIGEINNGFIRMVRQLDETINDVYISKLKQREAELTALESQINPHFLYNTLDSIHWLAVKHKNYDVSEQIEALAEIFRHVLNKGEPFVTIRQELDFLDSYMLIQKRKYGRRIRLIVEADQELMNRRIPKLILQPLVENAIVHGLEQIVEGGTIKVSISRVGQKIQFLVTDNGKGTDEIKIHQMMSSAADTKNVFALKNIDDRIKLHYGLEFGLTFLSKPGLGTQVEILIQDKVES